MKSKTVRKVSLGLPDRTTMKLLNTKYNCGQSLDEFQTMCGKKKKREQNKTCQKRKKKRLTHTMHSGVTKIAPNQTHWHHEGRDSFWFPRFIVVVVLVVVNTVAVVIGTKKNS